MRKLIQIISQEYGKEALTIFRKWENLNMKTCNYKNHGRLSSRCLGNGFFPVSIRPENNIRTQRSDNIIQRAERSLLSEIFREVNIILDCLEHDTYMYETKLSGILSQYHMRECKEFITDHKELRHKLVMECQRKKYVKFMASEIPGWQ